MKAVWDHLHQPAIGKYGPIVHKAERALKKCQFCSGFRIFPIIPKLRKFCRLLLPAAVGLEKDVHDQFRKAYSYLPKVIDAPGESLPDAKFYGSSPKKWGIWI